VVILFSNLGIFLKFRYTGVVSHSVQRRQAKSAPAEQGGDQGGRIWRRDRRIVRNHRPDLPACPGLDSFTLAGRVGHLYSPDLHGFAHVAGTF